jgi:YD repeat-containing protein
LQVRTLDEGLNNRCNLYDLAGRLITVLEYTDQNCNGLPIDGHNYITSYSYDWTGNLRSLTNAALQLTRYSYDNLNRLTSTIYPEIPMLGFAPPSRSRILNSLSMT